MLRSAQRNYPGAGYLKNSGFITTPDTLNSILNKGTQVFTLIMLKVLKVEFAFLRTIKFHDVAKSTYFAVCD